MNTSVLFDKYSQFISENKNLSPKIKLIPLPQKQNSFQYVGAQILHGKLCSVVNSAEQMLLGALTDGSITFKGSFGKQDFKWTGGCVYQNTLYMFPRSENKLLAYHTDTEAFEEIHSGFEYIGEHHYGGVCTPSGIIYQPPRNTDHILKWNLNNKTCEKVFLKSASPCRYCGSVIHPDGFVYFTPEIGHTVMRLNTKTDEIEHIGEPIECMAFDPTISADRNIYGFSVGKGILKIDTQNGIVSIIHDDVYFGAYGTKLGINGKLYSLPGYTNDIMEFDPLSDEVKKLFSLKTEFDINYAGGATDENGNIYALPVKADNILLFDFQEFDKTIPSYLYDRFFKDFY